MMDKSKPYPYLRVAFYGPAGTGKSSAAKHLQRRYGGRVLSFAAPLKADAYKYGWDGIKDDRGRKFLQELGQLVRSYNEDYWLDTLLCKIDGLEDPTPYFVDDLRFPNELEGLLVNGFKIIQINPVGWDLTGDWRWDESETSLTGHQPHAILYSSPGRLDNFYTDLDDIINVFREG